MEYFYMPAKAGDVHIRDHGEAEAYPLLVGAAGQEAAEHLVQKYLGRRANTAGRPIRTPMSALGKLSPFGALMDTVAMTQVYAGSVTITAVIMSLPKSRDVNSSVIIEAHELGRTRVVPLHLERTRGPFQRITGTKLFFRPEDLAKVVTAEF